MLGLCCPLSGGALRSLTPPRMLGFVLSTQWGRSAVAHTATDAWICVVHSVGALCGRSHRHGCLDLCCPLSGGALRSLTPPRMLGFVLSTQWGRSAVAHTATDAWICVVHSVGALCGRSHRHGCLDLCCPLSGGALRSLTPPRMLGFVLSTQWGRSAVAHTATDAWICVVHSVGALCGRSHRHGCLDLCCPLSGGALRSLTPPRMLGFVLSTQWGRSAVAHTATDAWICVVHSVGALCGRSHRHGCLDLCCPLSGGALRSLTPPRMLGFVLSTQWGRSAVAHTATDAWICVVHSVGALCGRSHRHGCLDLCCPLSGGALRSLTPPRMLGFVLSTQWGRSAVAHTATDAWICVVHSVGALCGRSHTHRVALLLVLRGGAGVEKSCASSAGNLHPLKKTGIVSRENSLFADLVYNERGGKYNVQ